MAMPEARIGFFPDVGATGWLFLRCPEGYPEYLGLTGYEMKGKECVRLGLATHYAESEDLTRIISLLENYQYVPSNKVKSADILKIIAAYLKEDIPANLKMDEWVKNYFAGKEDLREIIDALKDCSEQEALCADVFAGIAQRSPTALVLTLMLLRHNERLPLAEVFNAELKAARFIARHPDYTEGVRARLIDKDDAPRWQPDKIEQVSLSGLEL
jgi:enoyl-CoA hydratase/carnithine racemase